MGQAAVNLWAEEAPENPQPFVYAVSLIKLLLCFSDFVLLRHNAWNPTRSNIFRLADKLHEKLSLRLHIFLNRFILEQIIGEDNERLERKYIRISR